jgi:hypothetical protein
VFHNETTNDASIGEDGNNASEAVAVDDWFAGAFKEHAICEPWYSDCAMGRVNIVKQVKIDGKWILRSIPKKESGNYDWTALRDGDYCIEWRQDGRRRRQPAGLWRPNVGRSTSSKHAHWG